MTKIMVRYSYALQAEEQDVSRRIRSGCSKKFYDWGMEAGSRTISTEYKKVSWILLFVTDYIPIEEKFFDTIELLEKSQCLNVDMSSLECGTAELHLVWATGTQFGNNKGLEVKKYDGIMNNEHI